jgi:alkanesulfonate monooxygenase SsuD/methylene tetrahydromethanopterin reductase-like flavin-dependent oxidoreductase (luciferase family)
MPSHPIELTMRFDLRVPPFAKTSFAAQYEACLAMCQWAEERGFARIMLSEHHGDPAGFLSAPATLAAAILARTTRIEVVLAALLVPLYDPVRLAEQLAAIDCLAPSRLTVIVGAGYRKAEFDMAGVERKRRGLLVEECVALWEQAWTGKPFEWQGRRLLVTPPPATPGGPRVVIGGKSEAAARRAARMRRTFYPANADPVVLATYLDECRKIGFDGRIEGAPAARPKQPGFVMVSRNPEATWAAIGENALYDAATYAAWQDDTVHSVWVVPNTSDIASLRASGNYAVVTPGACRELALADGSLSLHPLMGGIAPELAWDSLRLLDQEVLPALAVASA